MKHVNIPVFIPHLGCPNQCVFCNQRSISGVKEFYADSLSTIIDTALSTIPKEYEVEIAFFGGSFTGIDRSLMVDLLKTAYSISIPTQPVTLAGSNSRLNIILKSIPICLKSMMMRVTLLK